MSGDSSKLDARMDGWLKDWPAPEREEAAWETAATRIEEKIAPLSAAEGDDDWLAAPLPAEPGEGDSEPAQQVPSEVRMSEPSPDKMKRKSLKDIAQRVSAAPPAPASTAEPPPPSGRGGPRVSAPPEAPARPAFVSRPTEARDSDSGILDLAAVRASQASLPDSGAAPGTEGLFDDDKASAAAAAAPAKPASAKKSSSVIPLVGGGVVAIAAIAAAFFVVMKRSPGEMASQSPPAAAVVASAAAPGAEFTARPATTETGAAAEPLAIASSGTAQPLAENAGDRAATGGAEPAKASSKEESKGAGEKTASADAKKEPAAPAPTDLTGAMATAVGANTSQPAAEKKDEPAGPAPGSIPESPSQGAIQGALGSVMGAAKGCVAGMDAPSRATVVFGSSGRVKSVSVTGPAASTGAAGCIKSALSKASVGPFQRDSYAVGVTIRP